MSMSAVENIIKKSIVVFYVFVVTIFIAGCANAGDEQMVHSGDKVVLDGSASTPRSGWKIVKYR